MSLRSSVPVMRVDVDVTFTLKSQASPIGHLSNITGKCQWDGSEVITANDAFGVVRSSIG